MSLVGLFLLSVPPVVYPQSNYLQESEKKAKEILGKAVEALGGESFRQVRDITVAGRYYEFRQEQLQGTTVFQSYTKFPDKYRNEMGKKKEIVIINDGDKGWKIEYKNVTEQSPEEIQRNVKNGRHSLDYVFRFLIKEAGIKFRYVGRVHQELDEAEELLLIGKDNDRVRILISATTYLPLKLEYQSPGIGNRWATEDEKYFYNYHNVDGVQIPYKTVRFANGFKVSEVHLETATLDSGLPDSLFTPTHSKR